MALGVSTTDNAGNNKAYDNQLYAAVATGLGGACVMFAMNFPTLGVASMQRDPQFQLSDYQGVLVASLVPAFAIPGNFVAGVLVEMIGRKKTALIGGVLFVLSYMILIASYTATHVLIARALSGFGGSLSMIGGMVYMAEVMHPSNRERLGCVAGLLINAGMLAVFLCGSAVEWRGVAWIGLLMAVPLVAMVSRLKETPLKLIKEGNEFEALETIKIYRSTEHEAMKEYKELVESTQKIGDSGISFGELLSRPYITPVLTAVIMLVAQQTTGITGVTVYAVNIFRHLDTPIHPTLCIILIGVVNLLTTIVSATYHLHYDRKPSLLKMSLLLVVLEFIIGLFFWAKSTNGWLRSWADNNSSIALVFILMFYVVFGISLGPMPFMYLTEGLPTRIRGPASAIAITVNMLLLFAAFQVFGPIVDVLGYHNSFFLFACVTCVGVLVAHSLMIETKGKSITEIDQYYETLRKAIKYR